MEKLQVPFNFGVGVWANDNDDNDVGKHNRDVQPPADRLGPNFDTEKLYDIPATIPDRNMIPRPLDRQNPDAVIAFLMDDLNLDRLTKIHSCLWLAGRPQPARPLHRQLMAREIVITEQFDLHLVWRRSRLYIKPLPSYLLDRSFWETYLVREETEPDKRERGRVVRENACGFLLSYVWLIRYESDMRLARDKNLVPKIAWNDWRRFTDSFLQRVNAETLDMVNKRFHHGELRADRLNYIYRFYLPVWSLANFFRGYTFGYTRYGEFFWDKFAWLITVFAYATVLLSALQTGLSLKRLNGDVRFQRAAFGVVAFSIVLPVAVAGSALILFLMLFISNWVVSVKVQKKVWHIRHPNQQRKVSWWQNIRIGKSPAIRSRPPKGGVGVAEA